MPDSPASCKTRIREAVAAASGSLDPVVAETEASLASAWLLQRQGRIAPRDVPGFVEAVIQALKKVAPPPPKKVKFSDPIRKVLPLAESSVRPAVDVLLLLLALTQVGDFTQQTDKKRKEQELFLDDWRRMIWESARISDWPRFRQLATSEERVLEGRLSRESTLAILQGIQGRRADNITPIPDVSILACGRCGGFRGRDRVRCATCRGTYCTRCVAPTADLCMTDYAARYAGLDPAGRQKIASDARALLKELRIDGHTRIDALARALAEKGVDVGFSEEAPLEGHETDGKHGRIRLSVRAREGPAVKRAIFAALGRASFRAAGAEIRPLEVDYFVETCMGVPVDDALRPGGSVKPEAAPAAGSNPPA
jgi:ribosomal protein L12E/L44/L45/RPP1/RPP2